MVKKNFVAEVTFKSSAYWLRILWVIFCCFASSFNDKLFLSRNCSLTWSSLQYYFLLYWYYRFQLTYLFGDIFPALDERSCRSMYISSIKKAFKAIIFALISPDSCWWCGFNEYRASGLNWITGAVWLPIKGKLLLTFSSRFLTEVSYHQWEANY